MPVSFIVALEIKKKNSGGEYIGIPLEAFISRNGRTQDTTAEELHRYGSLRCGAHSCTHAKCTAKMS